MDREKNSLCFHAKENWRKEIFLSEEINEILVRYLERRMDDNEYIFPDKTGTRAINRKRVMTDIRRRLNGVGAHEIRKACYWGPRMKKKGDEQQ